MAQRAVVAYYSDVSGTEIDEQGVVLRFELDGSAYEIDLAKDELDALRAALAPFVAAARPTRRVRRGRSRAVEATAGRAEPSPGDLREWAAENEFDVPSRGRVPELVREAYKAAHDHRDVVTINRPLSSTSEARWPFRTF